MCRAKQVLLVIAICYLCANVTFAADAAKNAPSPTAVAQAGNPTFAPNQPVPPQPGPNQPGKDAVSTPPQVPTDPYAAPGSRPFGPPAGSRSEQAIRRALGEPTELDVRDQTLLSAFNTIKSKHNIEIQIDGAALAEAKIDPAEEKVSLTVKDIALRSALNLLLLQYDLTYVIKDEVLLITTKAKADTMFDTRLYDMRELVVSDQDPNGPPNFDNLLFAIRSTVNPQSWDRTGSSASITSFGSNGICVLIVVQTFDGHEQMQRLLSQLKQFRPQRAMRQ